MTEIVIRAWRIVHIAGGAMVFVDPRRETVRIYDEPDPRLSRAEPMNAEGQEMQRFLQEELFSGPA